MSEHTLDVRTPDLHPLTVPPLPYAAAPLTVLDRVSLRLGLWLLLRTARSAGRLSDHERHARRVRSSRELSARDTDARRLLQLAPRL